MLDRMFSSGFELIFPVAAPLCIDPADHGEHIVDLHRDPDVDETGFLTHPSHPTPDEEIGELREKVLGKGLNDRIWRLINHAEAVETTGNDETAGFGHSSKFSHGSLRVADPLQQVLVPNDVKGSVGKWQRTYIALFERGVGQIF